MNRFNPVCDMAFIMMRSPFYIISNDGGLFYKNPVSVHIISPNYYEGLIER
ncbi:hypothetical protein [Dolichospermum sp. UHCC 0260]|uniref:hypothetical protein n=1 Tax=Dolichospermum sp. UHCC 0260 TaxID=2590025 RepID=UPI001C2C8E01|nr:hypothetical protein [Dolichospermum sp. UHCC 0260]